MPIDSLGLNYPHDRKGGGLVVLIRQLRAITLQLFAFRWSVSHRIQLQFVVYLLMVLGLGIAAWRRCWSQVPDRRPLPATRPASVPGYAVGFHRAFYHSLPLSLCERQKGCALYDLLSLVLLSYAGDPSIFLPGTFTWPLVETDVFLPPVAAKLPRRSQHPSRRVSITHLVYSCDQTTGSFITVAFMSSDFICNLFRQLSSLVPVIGNMQTQRVD